MNGPFLRSRKNFKWSMESKKGAFEIVSWFVKNQQLGLCRNEVFFYQGFRIIYEN